MYAYRSVSAEEEQRRKRAIWVYPPNLSLQSSLLNHKTPMPCNALPTQVCHNGECWKSRSVPLLPPPVTKPQMSFDDLTTSSDPHTIEVVEFVVCSRPMSQRRLRAPGSSNWPHGWVGPVVLSGRELLSLLACLLLSRSGSDALRSGRGAGSLGSLGDWLTDAGRTEEEHVVWKLELFWLCGVCVCVCVMLFIVKIDWLMSVLMLWCV